MKKLDGNREAWDELEQKQRAEENQLEPIAQVNTLQSQCRWAWVRPPLGGMRVTLTVSLWARCGHQARGKEAHHTAPSCQNTQQMTPKTSCWQCRAPGGQMHVPTSQQTGEDEGGEGE